MRSDPPLNLVRRLYLFGIATIPILVARIGPITVSDIAFFLATALALPRLVTMRVQGPLAIGALLMAAGGVLASWQSTSAAEGLAVVARLMFILVLWALLTRQVGNSVQAIKTILAAVFIGVILTSAAAVAQVQLGVTIPNSEIFYGRASGLGTHPNGQGGFLAFGVAAAVGAFLQGWHRRLAALAIPSGVIGLLLAGTVSGMLATAIGVLVGVILGGLSFRKLLNLSLAGVVVYYLFTASGRLFPDGVSPAQRFLDTTGRGVGESTLFIRLRTMEYAWNVIWADFPHFGVGLASRDGWTTEPFLTTHNMLLLVWLQAGIVALVGLVIVILAAFNASRRAPTDLRMPLVMGCSAAFAAAMTGPLLYDRFFWLPFLLAFAGGQLRSGGDALVEAEEGSGAKGQIDQTQRGLARR